MIAPRNLSGGLVAQADRAAIVYVVEDDALVRRSVERIAASAGARTRSYRDGARFLGDIRRAEVERPACVVLDVALPDTTGIELFAEMRRGPSLPVIFVTGRGTIPMSVAAMKAGAVDFLVKPVEPAALLRAIRAAIDRDQEVSTQRLEHHRVGGRYATLTRRERQVLALMVAGLPNKRIAGDLVITERTVKFHRAHVMEKMGAASLADLVRLASAIGTLTVPR